MNGKTGRSAAKLLPVIFSLSPGVSEMVPMQAVFERALVLLGADPVTLGPSASGVNKLMLLQSMPAVTPSLVIGDVVESTFTGYAARNIASPSPQSLDPANGDSLLSQPQETTGYLWETTNTANLPQDVVGFAVVNSAKSVLFAIQALDKPVTLNAANQSISIPIPNLRLPTGAIS